MYPPVAETEDEAILSRNFFHAERLGTFIAAGWPEASLAKSLLFFCTPQNLAQAGLEFYAKGQGRCVFCWCIVKDLQPTSDPWRCHSLVNPDCPLILLGKRSHANDGPTYSKGSPRADDYTLKEFIELLRDRRILYLKKKREEMKQLMGEILAMAYEKENELDDDSF